MAASLIGGRVRLHVGYTAAGHVSENAPQQHEIEDSLFVVSIEYQSDDVTKIYFLKYGI